MKARTWAWWYLAGCAGALSSTAALGACPPLWGDVNGNGDVAVTDVQCTLLAVLHTLGGEVEGVPTCLGGGLSAADLDCSGAATVVDAQLVIGRALEIPLTPAIDADGNTCPDTCDAPAGCSLGLDPSQPYTWPTSCHLPAEAVEPGTLTLVEAFPNLPDLSQPIFLTHAGDGSGRIFVVEQTGKILVFPNDPAVSSADVFLDFSGKVTGTSGEGGMLGLAFHPNHAENGTFFISYTRPQLGGGLESVFSRVQVSAANPNVANPASEEILLVVSQPYPNHNGGWIGFGPDGYLYIALGDGGAACGISGDAQNPMTLRGSILRIDVDTTTAEKSYGIPSDNPWADGVSAAPETWAYGMRNPWRLSFDTVTGALWAGDVGQGAVEEIDVITKGGNYGWNVREGTFCQPVSGTCIGLVPPCVGGPFIDPVTEYNHTVGRSVTGGTVYRGAGVPSLQGAYVYGDFVTSAVFVWHYATDPAPQSATLVSPQSVASFGTDEQQELYLLGYQGSIYRFDVTGESELPPEFPTTLTATGCFSDLQTLTPAPGLIPFTPTAPLWSDDALKTRWVSLPEGQRATYSANGRWIFPVGTTFVKHFEMELVPGNASSRVRLETRLLVVDDEGIRGYSYRWNDAGTEATLLPAAATRQLTIEPPEDEPFALTWEFPSRSQCRACHTQATGGVLGPETRQLNSTLDYGCGEANQIAAWRDWGLLENPPTEAPEGLPSFVDPQDTTKPAEPRARAFLHANCSHCHLPGGATGTAMDLRATALPQNMGAVLVPAQKGSSGEDLYLIDPGYPELSELSRRLVASPPQRMPPLATAIVPAVEVEAVNAWIETIAASLPCPSSGATGKATGYGKALTEGINGVEFYATSSINYLYVAWTDANLANDDVWVALRWPGGQTSQDMLGGTSFAGGGWSSAVVVQGAGLVCRYSASSGGSSCTPSGAFQHYAGWANLPNTTIRIPWASLGLPQAPAEVELTLWASNNAGDFVWSTAPASNPTGPAPQPATAWHTLPPPTCLE